jgi:hypothetical protein
MCFSTIFTEMPQWTRNLRIRHAPHAAQQEHLPTLGREIVDGGA